MNEELGERLWDKVKNLPQGKCHGDLHRGNLLQNSDGQLWWLNKWQESMADFAEGCIDEIGFKWRRSRGKS